MVGLRLFLPPVWTDDPDRMARAHVPMCLRIGGSADRGQQARIAVQELDRLLAVGLRFACVLADAGYGSGRPFRQALSQRGLAWAVGLSRRQNVCPADTGLVFPEAARGRRCTNHIPDPAWPFPQKPCWPERNGRSSAGGGAPKAS